MEKKQPTLVVEDFSEQTPIARVKALATVAACAVLVLPRGVGQ